MRRWIKRVPCFMFVLISMVGLLVLAQTCFAQTKSSSGYYYPAKTRAQGGYFGWLAENTAFKGWHLAWDFKKKYGDEIVAVADGEVVLSDKLVPKFGGDAVAGGAVVVKHQAVEGGRTIVFFALYGHLENLAPFGARVVAGQRVGTVGHYISSSSGDIPHLHFGVHPYTLAANPYLGYTKNKSDTAGWVDPIPFIERTTPVNAATSTYTVGQNSGQAARFITCWTQYQGKLGKPIAPVYGAAIPTWGTAGEYQKFEGGVIYCSYFYGAFALWGATRDVYENNSGSASVIGFVTTPITQGATSRFGTSVTFVRGEPLWPNTLSGSIYESTRYGTHLISGAISVEYEAGGGSAGDLGVVTSGLQKEAGKNTQLFENGLICSSPQGTFTLREGFVNAFRFQYNGSYQLGSATSQQGGAWTSRWGRTGYYQRFQYGSAYGYFVNGKIVAWPVYGPINRDYEKAGGTGAYDWGFPLGNPYYDAQGNMVQLFEGGLKKAK